MIVTAQQLKYSKYQPSHPLWSCFLGMAEILDYQEWDNNKLNISTVQSIWSKGQVCKRWFMRVTYCLCCTVKKLLKKRRAVTFLEMVPVLFSVIAILLLTLAKPTVQNYGFLLENACADKMSQVGWEWKPRMSYYWISKTCMKLKPDIKSLLHNTCAFNCAQHVPLFF